MTEWSDAEISRRLALAIGWPKAAIHQLTSSVWVSSKTEGPETFDYRDPAVIWPIAEQFDCFPNRWDEFGQESWMAWCDKTERFAYADTAAKAVALAVIKAKEQT